LYLSVIMWLNIALFDQKLSFYNQAVLDFLHLQPPPPFGSWEQVIGSNDDNNNEDSRLWSWEMLLDYDKKLRGEGYGLAFGCSDGANMSYGYFPGHLNGTALVLSKQSQKIQLSWNFMLYPMFSDCHAHLFLWSFQGRLFKQPLPGYVP
jgi:hypothetical protein